MHIIFTDGLGNQMFQYAMLLSMRKHGKNPIANIGVANRGIVHAGFELLDDFQINRNTLHIFDGGWLGSGITIFALRHLPFLVYKEVTGKYDTAVFSSQKPIICGYWQDEKYFNDIADEIKSAFSFKNIDERNMQLGREMSQCESVSIHIRRGDYLKFPDLMVCTLEYYDRAIEYVRGCVNNPVFYVFSDDLKWSEAFMKERGVDYRMINYNRGHDSYKDMYLMTQCRHNILANSSFSWWGAWLGKQNGKVVVCPEIWRKGSKLHPQLDGWKHINP